ncbi:MAG: YicC family protein [Litoreibacter sp.]|nr:YicC family protein [Litoreibacter sp.]
MIHSMTGFASQPGGMQGFSWVIEIRSVNAKGLDIRVRAPERMTGVDQQIKTHLQKALTRGSVNVSLRVEREGADGSFAIAPDVLNEVLIATKQITDAAAALGTSIAPATAAEILAVRGVVGGSELNETWPGFDAIKSDLEMALEAFIDMRAREGEALNDVLASCLDSIETLTTEAEACAAARKDAVAANLRENVTRILANTDAIDETRLAQELALLAVKADVTEEIDRLAAHVTAARDLLVKGGAVGRKLDFLMQEFNREANTMCSKSGSTELTQVGLDLKALIDQMREQVQNVE